VSKWETSSLLQSQTAHDKQAFTEVVAKMAN